MEVVPPSAASPFADPNSSRQQGFCCQSYGAQHGHSSPQAGHVQATQQAAQQSPQAAILPHAQAFMAMPGAQSMQTPYWPTEMPQYPASPSIHERIIHQVHYYFSPENLCRDEFLRGHMDPREGWLPIPLLASFNRLRSLTMDVQIVAEALSLSPELEVRDDGLVRKRHDWQRWLLPQVGGPTSPTPASPDNKADATSPLLSPRSSATGISRVAEPLSADPTGSIPLSHEMTAPVVPSSSRGSPASSGSSPRHQAPQPKQQQPTAFTQHGQWPSTLKSHSQQQQQQQPQQQPALPPALAVASSPDGGSARAPSLWRDVATQSAAKGQTAGAKGTAAPSAEASAETGGSPTRSRTKEPAARHGGTAAATTGATPRTGRKGGGAGGAVDVPAPSDSKGATAPALSPKAAAASSSSAAAPATSRGAGKRVLAVPPSVADEAAAELALLREWQVIDDEVADDWRTANELWEAQLRGSSAAALGGGRSLIAEERWETAPQSRRGGRRGGAGERKDSGDASSSSELCLTHLKDSPQGLVSDRTRQGEARGHPAKWDGDHSDETTVFNDEDWSSAGSAEEPRPASPAVAHDAAATLAKDGSAAAAPSSPGARKRQATTKAKAAEKPPPPPAKPRGLRELNDAPPLQAGGSAASMLAAIDFELVSGVVGTAAAAASRCAAAQYERVLAHTPRTRALVEAHGAERSTQIGLVLIVLLVILMLPPASWPPTLPELGASRWLELPLGLALSLRVNDLGHRLWALCTPHPVSHSRSA